MDFIRLGLGRNLKTFRYSSLKFYSDNTCKSSKKGLVLGVYSDKPEHFALTKSGEHFNTSVCSKLSELLDRLKLDISAGSTRIFYDLSPDYAAVCVSGLGKTKITEDPLEDLNEEKERVRIAAAAGAAQLKSIGIQEVEVDSFCDAESAAEGVTLGLWEYDDLKNKEKRKKIPKVTLYKDEIAKDQESNWNLGVLKGEAQNIARRLTDTPGNLMTPSIFGENAKTLLKGVPKTDVIVRDKNWAEKEGMNVFLSVAKGSDQPPLFLEIHYKGASEKDKPVVFVGKGITFDTGGYNIKSTPSMADMRADMGGAACVLATTYAAAKLCLPINITTLIPLAENMVNGKATKPGDVFTAMNGKTVRVDNTDAEGRLALADALCYSKNFNPQFVMDVATLTGAMAVAMGADGCGAFSNSTPLWEKLHSAGVYTGDRVWRFPLWKSYLKGTNDNVSVDLTNARKSSWGGAAAAAAFLREFIPPVDWIHLDIASVMMSQKEIPYIAKGCSGRPTRTLIQFLREFVCANSK